MVQKYTTFEDLLISFNPYFRIDEVYNKSEGGQASEPYIIFISKSDGQKFTFQIPRTDIYDYSNGKKSESINNMIITLISVIRDYKIGGILDDNI